MTLDDFKALADAGTLGTALQALWADRHGDWERAHTLAQEANSPDGDWVHAYLHRKEGDLGNAGYWYARAGRDRVGTKVSFDAEWETITSDLLARADERVS